MNWIMIDDELPKQRTKVLGYIRDTTEEEKYYEMVVGRIELKDGSYTFVDFCGTGLGNLGHNVVAWMPIPDPPNIKESTKKKLVLSEKRRYEFSSSTEHKNWLLEQLKLIGIDIEKPIKFYREPQENNEIYEGEIK